MKILAFIDMHGSLTALSKIKQKAKSADIIVCGGDFTIFEQGIDHILSEFHNLGKDFLIIPGNHESPEEIKKYCKKYNNIHYIHDTFFIKEDVVFLGWGGGGFSILDKEFEKSSKKLIEILRKNKEKAYVFICHAPPYGTKLDLLGKSHHGNKSLAKFIKENNIDLTICGHLHENENKIDKIGKSTVINPGKDGMLINI